jgi:hypothetical protein
MKNAFDVLRMKEQQILRVRREVAALRIAAPLLNDGVPPPSPSQREEVLPLDPNVLQSLLDSMNER